MTNSEEDPKFTKGRVRAWMREHLEEYRDARTGEINLTTMCEDVATIFGMNEEGGPLDDDGHWLWTVAVAVAPQREVSYGARA